MKVAVVGGRNIPDSYYYHIKNFLDNFLSDGDVLISGGAKGVDTMVERYAKERGIPIKVYRPDYKRYGRKAPLIRNRKIAKECDVLIAFPGRDSRGTWYTVNLAKSFGKRVKVIQI